MASPDSKRMPRGVCLRRREAAPRGVQAFYEALEKATAPAPTNSHHFNARSGIFVGRQKGGKGNKRQPIFHGADGEQLRSGRLFPAP